MGQPFSDCYRQLAQVVFAQFPADHIYGILTAGQGEHLTIRFHLMNQIAFPSVQTDERRIVPACAKLRRKRLYGRNSRCQRYIVPLKSRKKFLRATVETHIPAHNHGGMADGRMTFQYTAHLFGEKFVIDRFGRMQRFRHRFCTDDGITVSKCRFHFGGQTVFTARTDTDDSNFRLCETKRLVKFRESFIHRKPLHLRRLSDNDRNCTDLFCRTDLFLKSSDLTG